MAQVYNRIMGLDLAVRASHKAVIADSGRLEGKPFVVEMTPKSIAEALRRLRGDRIDLDGVAVALEPTGPSWEMVAALFESNGIATLLVPPQKSHDFRRFRNRHTKSDIQDAAALALLPFHHPEGLHPASARTSSSMGELVRLVRQRAREVESNSGRKKRVLELVRTIVPGLSRVLGDMFGSSASLAFLRERLDPFAVVAQGKEELRAFWATHARRAGPDDAERVDAVFAVCEQAVELLKGLRAANRLPATFLRGQSEVRAELAHLAASAAQCDELEAELIAKHATFDPAHVLEQIYGVGPLIAAAIDGCTGDVTRFPNAKAFVSYAGLCPRKSQTGVRDSNQPITKAGNRLLKQYFFLAADTARKGEPDLAARYARQYAKGVHHNAILSDIARRVAVRAFGLMKKRADAKEDPTITPTHVIREVPGEQLTRKEAKVLIAERYRRDVVAPERDRLARKRRGKADAEPATAAASETTPQKGLTPHGVAKVAAVHSPPATMLPTTGRGINAEVDAPTDGRSAPQGDVTERHVRRDKSPSDGATPLSPNTETSTSQGHQPHPQAPPITQASPPGRPAHRYFEAWVTRVSALAVEKAVENASSQTAKDPHSHRRKPL